MSITLKVIDLIDKMKIQNFFVEKGNRTYFTPIQIKFDQQKFEEISDRLFRVKGKPYKISELEKSLIKDLDY
ncbi:MAG: hypothetical protein QF441_04790 [Bacteriovoracaceae bacterium]|jgi:hypothetical protein|nr:hypothetical protein [Halobacteriovoraceae bacterium]MDP7319899.1 hypothetical protein [Bacteriovoracaceae bacterium]|tara:strand:+ start:187 stop:402 length:216 start_codon:yes stop_codon:yes gene_type:complete